MEHLRILGLGLLVIGAMLGFAAGIGWVANYAPRTVGITLVVLVVLLLAYGLGLFIDDF